MAIFRRCAVATPKGFTVVELLLGIALFGVLMPVIVITMNNISAINDRSKDLAIANIFAENKIEEIRSIGYNSANTGTVDVTTALPATLGQDRSGSYTITEDIPGQKVISLTLTIDGRGGLRTLNYRSVVGELGVGQ